MELRRRRFQTYRESLESIPSNMLYYQDERVFIIKDKYPKSIHHYLILPREDIEGIRYLRTDQGGIELVEVLEQRGLWLIESQLHMHVLSTDFCSPTRFQAQCYNAFTTQLFLSISDLRWYLDDRGSFELTAQELTAYANGFANEMKCLHCQCVLPDMDFLRSHMKIHLARRQSASGGQRQNPQDQHPSEKTEVKMIEIDTLATTSL
ncbi:hypothetical protein BGZ83_000529 [Gryganskiella cystojenkinii]|nr:hypothetical protein BGZ83_000529 [Gryganskiella cystojenkinii]